MAVGDEVGQVHYLMSEARRRKLTGIQLKDEADAPRPITARGTFLTD